MGKEGFSIPRDCQFPSECRSVESCRQAADLNDELADQDEISTYAVLDRLSELACSHPQTLAASQRASNLIPERIFLQKDVLSFFTDNFLHPNERKVVVGIFEGKSNSQIARELKVSESGMESRLNRIKGKIVKAGQRWPADAQGIVDTLQNMDAFHTKLV